MKLNLKDWKKVKTGKDFSVMRHPEGHEIKVMHSPLSKEHRTQIESLKLAEGGEAKPNPKETASPTIDPQKAKEVQAGATQSGWQPKKWAENVKSGLGLNAGGDVNQSTPAVSGKNVQMDGTDLSMPKQDELGFADGGEIPKSSSKEDKLEQILADAPEAEDAPISTAETSTPVPLPPGTQQLANPPTLIPEGTTGLLPLMAAGLKGQGLPESSPISTESNQSRQNVSQSVPQVEEKPSTSNPIEKQEGMLENAYKNDVSGINKEAKAQGELGKAEARVLQDAEVQRQTAFTDFQNATKKNQTDRQLIQEELKNGQIDPGHYWGSLSTPAKISTSIGLLLSGIGSGLGHTENMAMQYLNKQIDNDINAQKANLGKKENLLSANLKEYGNLRDAYEATRIQQNDTVINQLKAAAATAQDPLAKARAQQLIAQKEQEMAPRIQAFDMNRAMVSAAAKDAQSGSGTSQQEAMLPWLRQINPEHAKEIETRLVPGVGMAQVPVPQSTRDTLVAKQTLDKLGKDFYDWAAKNSGSLNPKVIAEGKTKAAELQSLYRNSINGGVFKKGEQEFIGNIVDADPTKFFNSIRVLPKLKEVINSNDSQLRLLKKSVGLPTNQQLAPQQQALANWAKANPNRKESDMILKKLGIQ